MRLLQIFESMKGVCYASLHLISHTNVEEAKEDQDLSLLAVLAKDLAKPMDHATQVIPEEVLSAILEGLKRRAVASVDIGFFSVGPSADQASVLLNHEHLDLWLDRALSTQDTSWSEETAIEYVRDLFNMILERATSPENLHTFPAHPAIATEAEDSNNDCMGITSPSIHSGFKNFSGNVRKDMDVALENFQLPDGSIVPILRSVDCLHKRARGQMCYNCKAAQNRWAVRLCRYKKAASVAADSSL